MDKLNISSDPWFNYMRKGEFGKAWEFSDQVLKSGINRDYRNTPRHFQCIWDGTSLFGKSVLVRCYHGLGDTIQFIRYTRLLKEVADRVIVWAQPAIIPLLNSIPDIDQLLPLHNGSPHVDYDVDVEIMEFPHIFRTTLESIPKIVPYLHVKSKPFQQVNGSIAVGLVWQGGNWDPDRNVPFDLLKSLFQTEGIRFFILQENAHAAGWEEGYGVYPGDTDLYEYARLLSGLDLLITIDSMPAHLAGALNRPVWLMLSAVADWRWMENRDDSPWYPSMRIFRQKRPGDWEDVVENVKTAICNISAEVQKLSS